MNQVFTKKKLAAALTLAFATGGAGVLAVAPVPGLVAEAHANQFADTTFAVGASGGVNVPKSATAAITGQSIIITEVTTAALSAGQIILTPSAGKFTAATAASSAPSGTKLNVGAVSFNSTTGEMIIPITSTGSGGAISTISVTGITMDTNSLSVGTGISVSVSTSSTVTGLTKGVSATLATVTAPGATIKTTSATAPTVGKLGAVTISNKITIAEDLLASLKDVSSATDEITVTLPSGFSFVSGGNAAVTANGVTLAAAAGTFANNVAKWNISNTGNSTAPDTVTLNNGADLQVFVPSTAADGNVDATVAVKLADGSTKTTTVTLFKVASSGTTNAVYSTGTTTAPTTYPTLYAGRATQNPAVDVVVKESVPGSLLAGGTVSLTFPSGVTAGMDYTNAHVSTDGTAVPALAGAASVTDTAGTTSEDGKGSIQATLASPDNNATATGGQVKFVLSDIDLSDSAAAGDLNVTVAGSANVTGGTAKIASVITATTTTPGAGSTVTAGSTMTLPEIVMVENKAGALAAGAINLYIANANGAELDKTGATVKAYKADGTDITSTILGSATPAIDVTTKGIASFSVTTPSSTSTGAVTFKINGLKATLLSSASAGNVTAVIGGAANAADITPTSDEGAKAFKQTVTIGKIVSSTVPSIPAATVTGTTSSQTIVGSAVAAGNDQGKLGSLYIAAVLPASQGGGVFLKNSSGAWVAYNPAAPVAYASPVTLGTHTLDIVSATNLSGIVGTKIYAGYGVGVTDFGVTAPWNAMLTNGTYQLIYTVVQ